MFKIARHTCVQVPNPLFTKKLNTTLPLSWSDNNYLRTLHNIFSSQVEDTYPIVAWSWLIFNSKKKSLFLFHHNETSYARYLFLSRIMEKRGFCFESFLFVCYRITLQAHFIITQQRVDLQMSSLTPSTFLATLWNFNAYEAEAQLNWGSFHLIPAATFMTTLQIGYSCQGNRIASRLTPTQETQKVQNSLCASLKILVWLLLIWHMNGVCI